MSNYNCYRHTDALLIDRFNTIEGFGDDYTAFGLAEWRRYIGMLLDYLSALVEERQDRVTMIRSLILEEVPFAWIESPRTPEEWILLVLRQRLRGLRFTIPAPSCPRIFVSHRQPDKNYALRMAWLAKQQNFAYWVDVLDPNLKAAPSIPARLRPLITACIIEMALLNCSHVIALITPRSPGSAWIPYEYGRVKVRGVVSFNAAAWLHPRYARKKFPEYMLLGERTTTEPQILQWLAREYWAAGVTGCKPEDKDDEDLDKSRQLPGMIAKKKKPFVFDVRTQRPVKLMKPLVLKKKGEN
jgi:hypothetical protein